MKMNLKLIEKFRNKEKQKKIKFKQMSWMKNNLQKRLPNKKL